MRSIEHVRHQSDHIDAKAPRLATCIPYVRRREKYDEAEEDRRDLHPGGVLLPLSVLAIVVLSFLLAGCKKREVSEAPPAQEVSVVTIRPHAVHRGMDLPGRTEAFEQAQIRPQVGGVILSRKFEQGSDVKAGQLLYQINPAPFQATYDRARAQLLHAQAAQTSIAAQLRRYRPLAAANAVSRQDYDNTLSQAQEAESDVVAAKAALDSAKVDLDWTAVRSPIDGRIGRMLVTPGTLVTAGQATPIALVTRLDPVYVDVNLADDDMLRLRRELASGQLRRDGDGDPTVTLQLGDGTAYEYSGKLRLAEVTVDPATGTLVLRAEVSNPDRLLMPGMYVHASIDEGTTPNAITIPQGALQRDTKGEPFVYVVDAHDKVEQRSIVVGQASGDDWVVSSGLRAGERVATSGFQKMQPGSAVKPVEASHSAISEPEK
ncbi:efflux RND transporter periplasmic adaptor subunit [Acetobacter sp.]|jgi:membrane fusion protein (multidrug efflux system)|uniref:efflux RND transporter periplasmic adaptor subunit n=1 Tax=Acetobacter sp. TaxID=440 RepID=UPI0025B8B252|nr:efflux RND transporter periplasmic adaptor subunit [Acetobacter sp.]MCH4089634.1 efflux RND transporter periplasmic adaptor subunit [Acetobacter sp.]MCI1300614.1 efflux RND transporter periplasmic adaptor subunit [Acetobacter sp.]MCI1317008.1 efflux RND transporter periplasmic adaptor subunit [Acetobacter sp.]